MPALLLSVALVFMSPMSAVQEVKSVAEIDLGRYAGLWHEAARFPNRFQTQCVGDVTATYTLRADGQITVVNRCRLKDGRTDEATGLARKARADGPNSQLKVRFAPSWLSFLPMVWGDYWVVSLADDYRYAVVGSPDHKYLWVLSRTAVMSDADYAAAVDSARANGFDTSKLVRTPRG